MLYNYNYTMKITTRYNWLCSQFPFIKISGNKWGEVLGVSVSMVSKIKNGGKNGKSSVQKLPIERVFNVCDFINKYYSNYLSYPLTMEWFTNDTFDKGIIAKTEFKANTDTLKIKSSQYTRMIVLIDKLTKEISTNEFFISLGFKETESNTIYSAIKRKSISNVKFLKVLKAMQEVYDVDIWFVLLGE